MKSLLNLQELDVEDESAVGWDTRKSLAAVGEVGWNGETTLSTDGHAGNTDVPSLDDLASTELEAEWLTLLVGYVMLVMLLTVGATFGGRGGEGPYSQRPCRQ